MRSCSSPWRGCGEITTRKQKREKNPGTFISARALTVMVGLWPASGPAIVEAALDLAGLREVDLSGLEVERSQPDAKTIHCFSPRGAVVHSRRARLCGYGLRGAARRHALQNLAQVQREHAGDHGRERDHEPQS